MTHDMVLVVLSMRFLYLAGFAAPITQFGSPQNSACSIGAANHPGITQANWTSCFACSGYSVNKCTKVAGSPTATDQFSLFRSEWLHVSFMIGFQCTWQCTSSMRKTPRRT